MYKIMLKLLLISSLAILLNSSCCDSPSLGNNFFIFRGDNIYDRIIVYNDDVGIFDCCNSGMSIIPNQAQYDENGNYAEYVEKAKSNSKWIIVRTYRIREKKFNYWIIDKRFNSRDIISYRLVMSYVSGPVDSNSFDKLLLERQIKLKF